MITRAKTNLAAGIVGLANVGKSTFFQAMSKSMLGNPANYPFATIDPEEARVVVPSERLEKLAQIYNPPSVVPATLQLVDIAGLVRGAASGNGLGNAFLSHIRAVDGLYHMVRAFDDADIVHIERSVDPARDAQIIHDELILKDMEYVQSAIDSTAKSLKTPGNQLEKRAFLETAELAQKILDAGQRISDSTTDWTDAQKDHLRTLSLLTTKPGVYVANISEEDYCFGEAQAAAAPVQAWVDEHAPGAHVVPLSVNFESRLANMSPEQILAESEELGGVSSALPQVVHAMRQALGLHSFLTAGDTEVREWTVRMGSTAPQAAGAIHGDLQKTFITANVIKFEDLVAANGDEAVVRKAGQLLSKGKEYIVEDGDVIQFRSGAARR